MTLRYLTLAKFFILPIPTMTSTIGIVDLGSHAGQCQSA